MDLTLGITLVALFGMFFGCASCCPSACCGGFDATDATVVISNVFPPGFSPCTIAQCNAIEGTYVVTKVDPGSWYGLHGVTDLSGYCQQFELTGLGGTTTCQRERMVVVVSIDALDDTKCYVLCEVLNLAGNAIHTVQLQDSHSVFCALMTFPGNPFSTLCTDFSRVPLTTIDFTC